MPISTCLKKYKINNYENYEVDINGNIFSNRFNRYLKPYSNGKGYQMVRLINNDGAKPFKVHRLLALQFIPNTENKKFVNHKNGIKNDNRIENLEWVTHSENIKHAYLNNLIKKHKICQ
jgi:hypothetical protein